MGNISTLQRMGVVVIIFALAATVYMLRPAADQENAEQNPDQPLTHTPLPRLLDLGADKCVPCKLMAPILEELKVEFAGEFAVQFIDVWKNPKAAEPFKLNVIPTQIFFAADGTELFRHEGFYGREDILNKWADLGITIIQKES